MDMEQDTVILESFISVLKSLPITLEDVLKGDFSALFCEEA